MKPKLTYPNHIPTCIAMTNHDIVDEERPIPPWSAGSRRYAGTHAFSPHQANRQHEFINAIATVIGAMPGLKSELRRPRSAASADLQIFGSSTLRRIHIVKSAGSTPMENTPLQPQIGMT